jgi:hypothetical protein
VPHDHSAGDLAFIATIAALLGVTVLFVVADGACV